MYELLLKRGLWIQHNTLQLSHISVQACLYLKIDPKLQDRISNIVEIGALNEYLIGPDCNNQLTKYIMVSIIYQALVDEDL